MVGCRRLGIEGSKICVLDIHPFLQKYNNSLVPFLNACFRCAQDILLSSSFFLLHLHLFLKKALHVSVSSFCDLVVGVL